MRRLVLRVILVGALALLLAGCGGGSSDSGGGGKAATPLAGEYTGFEALSVSGPGGTLPVGTFPLSVSISPNGAVVVTDVDGIQYFGQLGGFSGEQPANEFIATAFIAIPPAPGLVCQPNTYGYIGTVTGNTITGTATGTFQCSANGVTAFFTVSGPFWATRSATGLPPAPGAAPPGTTGPAPLAPGLFNKSSKQKAVSEGVASVL